MGSECYSFGVTRPLLDGFWRTPSPKYASEKSTFLAKRKKITRSTTFLIEYILAKKKEHTPPRRVNTRK